MSSSNRDNAIRACTNKLPKKRRTKLTPKDKLRAKRAKLLTKIARLNQELTELEGEINKTFTLREPAPMPMSLKSVKVEVINKEFKHITVKDMLDKLYQQHHEVPITTTKAHTLSGGDPAKNNREYVISVPDREVSEELKANVINKLLETKGN